jgi:hypothetical protein
MFCIVAISIALHFLILWLFMVVLVTQFDRTLGAWNNVWALVIEIRRREILQFNIITAVAMAFWCLVRSCIAKNRSVTK